MRGAFFLSYIDEDRPSEVPSLQQVPVNTPVLSGNAQGKPVVLLVSQIQHGGDSICGTLFQEIPHQDMLDYLKTKKCTTDVSGFRSPVGEYSQFWASALNDITARSLLNEDFLSLDGSSERYTLRRFFVGVRGDIVGVFSNKGT